MCHISVYKASRSCPLRIFGHPYIPHSNLKNIYLSPLIPSQFLIADYIGASMQQCYEQQKIHIIGSFHYLCTVHVRTQMHVHELYTQLLANTIHC